MVWEARQVAGSRAVLPSAQVLQLMYELLLVLCQQEPLPLCPQAWAMAYAAREGELLRAVCFCGVGGYAGVPPSVQSWMAPRALAALAALQGAQASRQSPRTALSLGAVTRPEAAICGALVSLPLASPPSPPARTRGRSKILSCSSCAEESCTVVENSPSSWDGGVDSAVRRGDAPISTGCGAVSALDMS